MPDPNDTCSYEYNALRRIKKETRQDTSTVELRYDLAGRMREREYSDSTTDIFEYDGANRLTSAFKERHDITVKRAYYPDGTMREEKYLLDGHTYTLQRNYDADNQVDTQTFADNKVMSWIHNERHLVTDVYYDGELVLEQDHDAGYRLTQQTFGNNLVRDIIYDRLDNMRTADTVKDGNNPIDELAFTYDYFADKNVEKEKQNNGTFEDLSFTATYDPGNRVLSYNRKDSYLGARETQTWDYDDAGNWDSTTIDGDTQNRDHSDSDQLEEIDGDNLTYDPRGNQLTDNRDNEYTWDLDNRIVEADGTGYSKIEYRYDALGRRIVREQGTKKEVLLWWNNTEQSEHKHQAGQTTIQNDLQANPSEGALNTIFARALEGDKQDIQYYHKNYLDHVMAVSDDDGDVLEHYRYTAFGEPEIYAPNGTKLTDTDIDNDILWNVRRYGFDTGLYLYKYRDYDAVTGRWPSRDPIGESGGVNLYGFVANNVIEKSDNLGLATVLTAIAACPTCPFGEKIRVATVLMTGCDKEWRTKKQVPGVKVILPAPGNACGGGGKGQDAPEKFFAANFTACCTAHDECYQTCGETRSNCDRTFLNCLLAECHRAFPTPSGQFNQSCVAVAAAYYSAASNTRIVPDKNFEDAQDSWCEWKPCCKK